MATSEVRLDLEGLDDLIAQMPQIVQRALQHAVLLVETRAKQRAPYLTGFLRSSIRAQKVPQGAKQGEVRVGAEYAIYHEFGTVHMPARPFLTPALESVRPELEAALRSAIAKVVP